MWVASTERASRKVDDIVTTSPAPRYRWCILEGCEMGVGEGRHGDLLAVKLLRGVYLFTAMSISKTWQQRIFQRNKSRARVKCWLSESELTLGVDRFLSTAPHNDRCLGLPDRLMHRGSCSTYTPAYKHRLDRRRDLKFVYRRRRLVLVGQCCAGLKNNYCFGWSIHDPIRCRRVFVCLQPDDALVLEMKRADEW